MKVVKQTAEYTVYQKRSNRYGVKDSNNQWINGDEKAKILLAEGLITVSKAAAVEEPAEEVAAEAVEEAVAESAEEKSTEAAAEKDGE